jgi:poly-gamma-glutamate synthesis protein (capsule biosynthesis protein)
MIKRFGLLLVLLLAACVDGGGDPAALPDAADEAALVGQAGAPSSAALPAQLPAEPPETWHIAGAEWLPPAVADDVTQLVADSAEWAWADATTEADVTFSLSGGSPFVTWVYAVAAPFATVDDAVSAESITDRWQNGSAPLLTTPDALPYFTALWGAPSATVATYAAADIADRVWETDDALALLPFDQLTPRLKVLAVDGQSPLARDFSAEAYPLTVTIGVVGSGRGPFLLEWPSRPTNRDGSRLTRVAMTGVTALVRATAWQMENNGVLWPADAVKPIFDAADLVHISNEVSFVSYCPYPDPAGGAAFCSAERYMALFEYLGVDIVELTGNHVNDYSSAELAQTIAIYEAAGLHTFGGGVDATAAAEPLLLTHNGNRLAFVGCNPVGPVYAWATASSAGSRPCDGTLAAQIEQLSAEGYQVIATQQFEEYYFYEATAAQRQAFQALADAGAVAVSGSQGHHAQGFAFHGDRFVHYGLGNLFFDQMQMPGTRQTFIDSYVFYDNRLLSVQLDTLLIEDYGRPRAVSAEERAAILSLVFDASDW